MAKDTEQVDRDAERRTGISPALAGAATFEGVPRVFRHALEDAPHGLSSLLASGKPITAEFATPLRRIAEFTRGEVSAIQDFARRSGVTAPIVAGHESIPSGYFFDPDLLSSRLGRLMMRLGGKKPGNVAMHIGLSRSSVPHALHEIGHASPVLGSHGARRALQGIGSLLGAGSSIGGLARMGLAGSVLLPPGEDASATRQFLYDKAPVLVGATFAPELLEEGRASMRALRGARKAGVGVLNTAKELAPAFSTYLGAAAAPILATLIAKKVVRALRGEDDDDGQEKQGAARAGAEVKAPGILRTSAASAWNIGGPTPPKPKSIKPNARIGDPARTRAPAKPPSNRAYHKDLLASLYNPQRGFRISKVG
jgi:hypothetical protein